MRTAIHGLSCLVLALVLGLVVVVNAGCMKCGGKLAGDATQKVLERMVEKATGGKAQVELGGDVDLSDLPVFLQYPGARPTAKWSLAGDKGTGSVYSLVAVEDKDTVIGWFKISLTGQEWKQSAAREVGGGTMLVFHSPDGRQVVTVLVHTDDGKTAVTIARSTKSSS